MININNLRLLVFIKASYSVCHELKLEQRQVSKLKRICMAPVFVIIVEAVCLPTRLRLVTFSCAVIPVHKWRDQRFQHKGLFGN